jgi:hypothetical protein
MLCKIMDCKNAILFSLLALAACSKPPMPQEGSGKSETGSAAAVAKDAQAAPEKANVTASAIPADVTAFVEKREGCDHFRGEEAYDEERGRFIRENLEKLCTGTDATLAALKAKYAKRAEVMQKLSEFEITIE